jgi:hypothetical protein
MNKVFLITSNCVWDGSDVIEVVGIADSVSAAEKMMKEYFGDYNLVSEQIVQDSGIEKVMIIEAKDSVDIYAVSEVTLLSFNLNQV